MLTYDEALKQILSHTPVASAAEVSIVEALGQVLSESVVSPFDSPRFDQSAVDGYAVKFSDQKTFQLMGKIPAGESFTQPLQPGDAVRIFTGASVPQGANAVVMQEFCTCENDILQVDTSIKAGDNIRFRAEEYTAGVEILSAGMVVTPAVVGVLASVGKATVLVYQKPRIGIVTTGNELICPGEALSPGQIYDSNSYALESAVHALDLPIAAIARCVPDSKEALRKAIQTTLAASDILVSVGGVSVGDYDFVKDVCEALDVETVFWKIAIKPGKPVFFGVQKNTGKLVFGLPGNPVAALLTFHQLVKPAVLKFMGYRQPVPENLSATLSENLKKKPGRMEFVRGIWDRASVVPTVMPTLGQDSHMLSGLAKANCLIVFGKDEAELFSNTQVAIEPLQWSLLT